MDKDLKEKIQQYYWKEYFASALAKKSGLLGKFTRWTAKYQNKWAEKAQINFMTATSILGGVAVGALATLATGGLAPFFIGTGVAFAYAGADITGLAKVNSQTRKNLAKDIENGTLVNRYQTEVLPKQLEEAQRAAANLQTKIQTLKEQTASPSFTEAAKNTPAPAAPARKHRFSLHRQQKL